MGDLELLGEYTNRQSDAAFTTLVERQAGLVYSAALRQVRDPRLAEEVTQAVFIILARKAHTIRRGVSLSGLLSAHAVQAAPAGLANSAATLALLKGTTAAMPILALVKGTLKMMAWLKIKTAAGDGESLHTPQRPVQHSG